LNLTTLTYEKKDRIAFISLAKRIEEAGLALTFATELSEVCSDIQADKDIGATLLFCEEKDALSMDGHVLREWPWQLEGGEEGPVSLAKPLARLEQPVVAGILGDAVGPGLELALTCDLRIGSRGSGFGLPHVRYGLMPWDGGIQRLSRLIGKGKAMEMILTAQRIEAQEAYRIGLLNRVASENELKDLALNMVTEMASKAPLSMAYAKEAVNKGMDLTLEQGLRLEADLYFLIQTSQDRTEGIKAFQEKRAPHFRGR